MLARKAGYIHYEAAHTVSAADDVHTADRRFGRRLAQTVSIVALIGFFILINIALSALKTNYTYTLVQEKNQVKQLQQENDNLRVDIAKLEAPEQVYQYATKKLGMVVPAQVLYGQSEKDKVAGHRAR